MPFPAISRAQRWLPEVTTADRADLLAGHARTPRWKKLTKAITGTDPTDREGASSPSRRSSRMGCAELNSQLVQVPLIVT
jgi:hypothetical protein